MDEENEVLEEEDEEFNGFIFGVVAVVLMVLLAPVIIGVLSFLLQAAGVYFAATGIISLVKGF